MARETIVRLTDDLSGGAADGTLAFAYRGQSYEIDLSDKNANAFDRDMAKYIEHARKASRLTAGARSSRAGGSRDYDLNALRAWATENGYQVSARGRIKQSIVDAYRAAGGR